MVWTTPILVEICLGLDPRVVITMPPRGNASGGADRKGPGRK